MSTLMSKLMSQSIENIFVSVENDCNFNTGTGTSLVSLSATSSAPVRCEQTSDFFEMGVIDQENGNSTTQRVLLCIKAKNNGALSMYGMLVLYGLMASLCHAGRVDFNITRRPHDV